MLDEHRSQQYRRFVLMLILIPPLSLGFTFLGLAVIPSQLIDTQALASQQASLAPLTMDAPAAFKVAYQLIFLFLIFLMTFLAYEWVDIALPSRSTLQSRIITLLLTGVTATGLMASFHSAMTITEPVTLGEQYSHSKQIHFFLLYYSLFAALLALLVGWWGIKTAGLFPRWLYGLSMAIGVLELGLAIAGLFPSQATFLRLLPSVIQISLLTIWAAYLAIYLQSDRHYRTTSHA